MEKIIPNVFKPGRYINKEWNSIHKEWKDSLLKVALVFPDIYEIGMSHVGMRILYGILNQEKDMLCERVFAPWSDMEIKMREQKETLLSIESQRKLKEFDVIGFSLQYEMNLVDVLNILDLGGVPIHKKDRNDKNPLIIAGGPCAFNPEPMSSFIDLFVIGEGEEVILEVMSLIKSSNFKLEKNRSKILKELSKIKGIYAPGTNEKNKEYSIKKRIINDLNNSYFPTKQIVPYIQVIHDRIGIEIMRGCPNKCKFCQACKIFHPLRIRSIERILEIAERSIKNTGYEKISLLSLSTGDYPYMKELVSKMEEKFKTLGVKITLPSLKVRNLEKSDVGTIVKKTGLTFAPETGSDNLRSRLNKKMKNEDIIQKSNLALKSGWRKVKLYFMIGLPDETYEDIDSIIELSSQIKNVNLSVSSFIPKPHSAFEKEDMNDLKTLKEKREYLKSKLKEKSTKRSFKMDFHDPEKSKIEAVLSRGDEKLGQVIYKVWQKGARLQAWTEYFNYSLWQECFQASGIDPDSYLKNVDKSDNLPWNFIES